METSQLILILSAIVFCFIFQTIVLKTRFSESLTPLEETLEKTQHKVESLSKERLDKVSGIIEESGKSFAETVQDVPSVISHLKEVHATQSRMSESLMSVKETLEKAHHIVKSLFEKSLCKVTGIIDESRKTFSDAMKEVSVMMSYLKQVHTTQKEHEDRILHVLSNVEQYGDATGKPIYITFSNRQILSFVFGIIILCAVVCFVKTC